nr:MAG TPA: hypothetical protein [Caudoviricetes sp.]
MLNLRKNLAPCAFSSMSIRSFCAGKISRGLIQYQTLNKHRNIKLYHF